MNIFFRWFRKKNVQLEYHKFVVSVNTESNFLIKYPKKDYSPKISESLSGNWCKELHVILGKPLYIEVFVNNPIKKTSLFSEVKVDEINEEEEIINTTSFSFKVDTEIENLTWNRFEVKSVLK
ncbi:MAG: hypothetical protein ACO21X_07705 [Sediminibacterium sp.]